MPGIGYSCKELEDGVEKLQILLKRKRTNHIYFNVYSNSHHNQMIMRLYSVALALATDSSPIITSQSMDKTNLIGVPDFGVLRKKQKAEMKFPMCFNETNLKEDTFFTSDMPAIIKPLLICPSVHRLTHYLGPAAYHILIHFALNLSFSEKQKKINNTFFVLEHMPADACADVSGNVKRLYDLSANQIMDMLSVKDFGYQTGNPGGWIITLLRGIPSYIYEPVSGLCYKGRSIMSGGLNPLYSGIYRDTSDFSRGGGFCGDPQITKDLLKQLL